MDTAKPSPENLALLYNVRLPEDKNVQVDKPKRKYTKRGTLTERMR